MSAERSDVVTLAVDTLLHQPFVTAAQLTDVLQRSEAECAEVLDTTSECRVDVLGASRARSTSTPRGMLGYRRPDDAVPLVCRWFEVHARITSGDHAAMTGLTVAAARRQLERLVEDSLLQRGDELGRNTHFTAAVALAES